MNIQEAAATSGLTPDTIRFYERKGVLPRPPRQDNGYRTYTAEHVVILQLAKGLRHLGVPLEEVERVVAVAHDGTCNDIREDMIGTFGHALAETEARLRDLLHVRDQLSQVLTGLRSMRGAERRVPGMRACACVQMVSDTAEE